MEIAVLPLGTSGVKVVVAGNDGDINRDPETPETVEEVDGIAEGDVNVKVVVVDDCAIVDDD
jgi:hypothetical protein